MYYLHNSGNSVCYADVTHCLVASIKFNFRAITSPVEYKYRDLLYLGSSSRESLQWTTLQLVQRTNLLQAYKFYFSGSNFRSATAPDPFSRASLQPAADFILSKISIQPVIGIICGSGLGEYSSLLIILTILPLPGELASLVSDPVTLPYSSIPGFPVSTAPGHSGKLVFGTLSGASVVLMQVSRFCKDLLSILPLPHPGPSACVRGPSPVAVYPTSPYNEDGWGDSSHCDQCCGWDQPCLPGDGQCSPYQLYLYHSSAGWGHHACQRPHQHVQSGS